ncbi:inactive pancreatic lipase-related protein 1 [Caerostris extrusa]|uniref:Inactive pancreatic lipase-related protein 1 n=1 Tax=Caerostris extrusa TaxID=172846 RepID=A0AAV4VA22_CAEEX|nr:inactive pancreatic lipase-related protein 1 [Caerostris extrusa]
MDFYFLLLVIILATLNILRQCPKADAVVCPPQNTNSSIQYLLYTPDHPQEPCYLEPNPEALERCPFNPCYPMKFLIYGYTVVLTPDNQFVLIKNQLLASFDFNVIIVNWTNYNQAPYAEAVMNTQLVGRQLANLIKYLEANKGVDPQNVHLIGHSLGAHLAGSAGQNTPNLGG